MKRTIFFGLILLFSFSAQNATSQTYDNAIGLRLGWGVGLTGKHFLNDQSAVEAIVHFGGAYTSYFQITGLYQVHNPLDEVFSGLQWYYGGGGFVGLWGGDNSTNSARIGIAGNIGLDYAFDDIPLNISLDWIPSFALVGFGNGFAGTTGGLVVRYIL